MPFRGMMTFIVLPLHPRFQPHAFPGHGDFYRTLSILGLSPMPLWDMMTFIVRYPS